MKAIKTFLTVYLLIATCAFAEPLLFIVVNKSVGAGDVDIAQLRQLYMSQQNLELDGRILRPIDAPDKSAARRMFTEMVLQQSMIRLKSYWAKVIFTGREGPPRVASSESEIEKIVNDDPAVIGYLSYSPSLSKVKVIKTIQ